MKASKEDADQPKAERTSRQHTQLLHPRASRYAINLHCQCAASRQSLGLIGLLAISMQRLTPKLCNGARADHAAHCQRSLQETLLQVHKAGKQRALAAPSQVDEVAQGKEMIGEFAVSKSCLGGAVKGLLLQKPSRLQLLKAIVQSLYQVFHVYVAMGLNWLCLEWSPSAR